MNYKQCQICNSELSSPEKVISNINQPEEKVVGYSFKCPKCGQYRLKNINTNLNLTKIEQLKFKNLFLMDEYDQRRLIIFDEANKKEVLSSVIYPKTLTSKIDSIISYFGNNTKFIGQKIVLNIERVFSLFFIYDNEEYRYIFDYITLDKKYLNIYTTKDYNLKAFELTIEGIKYYESYLVHNKTLDQCFVAMWFDDSLNNYYQIVKQAVTGKDIKNKENLDYGANYHIMKIDNKEHINYIPDEIISEIKRSKFVIADLTGNRGGVYYETGFAEGLGLPVILTCRKDWLVKSDEHEGVHFDLNQKNILLWTEDKMEKDYEKYKLSEFKKALIARIGATIGFND